ncbi:MAG: TonB-dependent receptor plug domain-containing protein [Steroidobacteraceae bacterium]
MTVLTAPAIAQTAEVSGSPENSPASTSQADTGLQEVVVSATRTEQPLDRTGSSIAVISGSDISTQQLLAVSGALAEVAGVSILRTGGPGQDTNLYLRGAAPGETLVLIDGIRINDPSTPDGQAVLGDLLVNDIARIEVLPGPQSTLYGSDAMGGVVNIITQRGGSQPLAAKLDAEGGSYGTWRVNAAASGTVQQLEYGGGVNYYDTRGFDAAAASSPDTDPDGDRNVAATFNVRLHADANISVDLRGFYTDSRIGIPGYPPPAYTLQASPEFLKDNLAAGYAGLNGSWLDGRFTQRLALIGSDSDRREFGIYDPVSFAYAPAENFYAQGGATRWEYQGVFQANAANQLTYGAESELTTLLTDSLPDPADTPTLGRDRLTSYYAQWQSTLWRRLTLTGGARDDHDDLSDNHTSFKLAGAWQLPDGATVLRATYASGFKAPTLYELFSSYSNPFATLRPEIALGWEAGIDHTLLQDRLRVSATYFRRGERQLIEFDDCVSADPGCTQRPFGYYYNVDRTRDRGLEAEVAARPVQDLSIWANYTNLTASDELTGLALPRVPHVAANAGITWATRGGASAGVSYTYTGRRYDSNNVPLAAAGLVNLFGSYPLSGGLQLQARIGNLFNDQAEPVYGYRGLGRALYAGLRADL